MGFDGRRNRGAARRPDEAVDLAAGLELNRQFGASRRDDDLAFFVKVLGMLDGQRGRPGTDLELGAPAAVRDVEFARLGCVLRLQPNPRVGYRSPRGCSHDDRQLVLGVKMEFDRPLGSGDELEGIGSGGFGSGACLNGPGTGKQVLEDEPAVAVGP